MMIRSLILCGCILYPTLANAGVAFVQAMGSASACRLQASANSIPCTWTSNTTTGNGQVGSVDYQSATDIITSIGDGTNTFTKIQTCSDPTTTQSITTFYKENATGGTTPTITVNFSASIAFRALAVHEVSGMATSGSLDKNTCQLQSAPGTGTDASTSGTTAALQAGDYEYGSTQDSSLNSSTHAAGTGYLRDTNGSSSDVDFASEHIAGGTTNAATWTVGSGGNREINMFAAFLAAASGGGGVSGSCTMTLLGAGPC